MPQQNAPLKGVNLGGWLILERWMTPAVFKGSDASDEFTLTQTSAGQQAIRKHRDTFITESDFEWLKDNEIDIIRLPIGYWVFEEQDSLLPHVSYVDWTMNMANKYGIKVLLDLHGLKGSQNGHDHSGVIGKTDWFKQKEYRIQSLVTLKRIAERYKGDPQLWGLQIINEPKFGVFHFKLRSFYKQASKTLEVILNPETCIIYSDGFTPNLLNRALGKSKRIIMDVHLYHGVKIWTKFVSLETYYKSLELQKRLIRRLSKTQPVIIGEWSGSFRQQVFDTIPTDKHGELVGQHASKQIASFEYAAAWFYWNYKTEKTGVWHFRSQVDEGYIKL